MVQTTPGAGVESARSKRVYLIGMPGVGKSVIGHIVARHLGWNYVDTDACVECQSGMSITEVFESLGEEGFRRHEADCLLRASGLREAVIATGGGTPVFHKGMDLMRASGTVIYLEATIETLMRHLRQSTGRRPLLKGSQTPDVTLKELLENRAETYHRAHVIVRVDEKTPEQIAEEILNSL